MMGEVLKRKPQVGDTLLYVGDSDDYVTHNKQYVVAGYDGDGDAYIYDDDGDREYIRQPNFGNYHVIDTLEDPGLISIYERNPLDTTGTAKLEVVVDEKGLKTLYDLQRQHERATAKARIEAQIRELEEELKKI